MTWVFVGVGAAVGAGAGAAIGSKKGGDDVWKGALIGGALGAGGGYLAAPAAAAGGAGVAGGAGLGAVEGGSGLALGGAGLETGGAMGGAGIVGGEAGAGLGALPGAGAFGSTGGATVGTVGGLAPEAGAGLGTTGTGMGLGQAGGFGSGATLSGSGQAFGTAGGATVGEVGGFAGTGAGAAVPPPVTPPPVTPPPAAGGLSSLEKLGIAGALVAPALMTNTGTTTTQEENPMGLASLSPNFKGYEPDTPDPYYKEKYKDYRTYAEGGPVALATGGDPMSPMSNSIYPQSQQQQTAFSTSPQMPNSMRAAMASDYDARTNPTTGQELPMGYASGGVARYDGGGWINTINSMHPGGALGDWNGQVYGAIADATGFNPGGVGGALMPGNYEYNKKLAEEEEKKRRAQEAISAHAGGGIIAMSSGHLASSASMPSGGIYRDTDPNTATKKADEAALYRMQQAFSKAGLKASGMPKGALSGLGDISVGPTKAARPQETDDMAGGGIARYDDGGYTGPRDGDAVRMIIQDQQQKQADAARLESYRALGPIAHVSGYQKEAADMRKALAAEDDKRNPFNSPAIRHIAGLPQQPQQMAGGGIAHYSLGGYSDGGRMLKGPGDGMSDSIPASIGGKQAARLADGEFVVPADVVSHLGNGSTDAGANKLYGMMDKVRKARTGTKKQGKQIKADKYLPK